MIQYTLRDASQEETYPDHDGSLKHEKYFQNIRFEISQLPEIGFWMPGETYTLVIRVRQKEHTVEKRAGVVEETATFEIKEVGAINSEHEEISEAVKKKLSLK